MNKPLELLSELSRDKNNVGTTENSKMVVIHGKERIEFNRAECEKVLATPDTVNQLFVAMGEVDASVELHELELTNEVLDELEHTYSAVDDV